MPPKPKNDPETTQLDTSKLVKPNADTAKETTPIGDEVAKDLSGKPSVEEYLKGVDEADVTHFEEDDDPQQFAGDPVED